MCKYINVVQNRVEKDIWQNDQGITFDNWYSLFNLGDKEDLGVASYISDLGSVVGIVTVYGLDGAGIESRWG